MIYSQSPSFSSTRAAPFTARIQPTKANANIKNNLNFEFGRYISYN